ncbi:hypothetical protein [Herbiconiux sp. VKM Ac-2851]|jgi:hypothetical protein|uniref:hypothetical protein n=1 Tax=Herbiconiux sp. VKM Ac-2851 TaxID=2739025 RepID=UPI00156551EB|nr:hypothetical protein [Herbiconiux sp. VKM Ac-2851]NQX35516.1 hypothetical protein [Herbiconiux sp. VKM Ac-2851]
MKRVLVWAAVGGTAVWLLTRKSSLDKGRLAKEAALAVWNDPAVKKTRKRTAKKIKKAAKKLD